MQKARHRPKTSKLAVSPPPLLKSRLDKAEGAAPGQIPSCSSWQGPGAGGDKVLNEFPPGTDEPYNPSIRQTSAGACLP